MKSPTTPNKHHDRRRATSAIQSNKQRSTNKSVAHSQIQKKKQHFKHNASMLREYQKVMKKEGFEPGQGASRKRTTNDNDDSVVLSHSADVDSDSIKNKNFQSWKKKQKMNPFAKSVEAAEQKKKEEEERVEFHKQRQLDLKQKVKQRKKTSRLLSQKTKKGQPVMNNVISVLLNKIQEKHSSK